MRVIVVREGTDFLELIHLDRSAPTVSTYEYYFNVFLYTEALYAYLCAISDAFTFSVHSVGDLARKETC
jgi:hypothetical protein